MNGFSFPRPSLSLLFLFVLSLPCGLPAQEDPSSLVRGAKAPPGGFWLEKLDLSKVTQDWGEAQAGKSVSGRPLRPGGVALPHGIGTHAESEFLVDLRGGAKRFLALVGLDGEVGKKGSVRFQVFLDGKLVLTTRVLHGGEKPLLVDVDLKGAKKMDLVVSDAGDGIDYDHADWGGALLLLAGGGAAPRALPGPAEEPPRIAMGESPEPSINHPRITGATPGRPFLFRIPASGRRPMRFSARGLPPGIRLDPQKGILSGSLGKAGKWEVWITAENDLGKDRKKLTIVGGFHKLALTPPMGWNSWNCWACAVTAEHVKAAADWMVKSGLADHGFQYINIDDCWEGTRDGKGVIRTNKKFPDMKALADYVHSKGLKLGIYSSPGPKTCAGYEGSYKHEEIDALTWAKWGIDYLKYDWCSYGKIAKDRSLPELMKPYQVMRKALDKAPRDIVFSLCQYGMGQVWKWGAKVGGNLWRTTGDIRDNWTSVSRIGFGQAGHEPYAGPGHWNDPDMLVVGMVGWGPRLHPSRLTKNEQVTHITLWSMLAAPLLIGCDMARMDAFTKALLSNDEVLGVNQDPLGRQAGRVLRKGTTEVWARPLQDGTLAVALFNRGRTKVTVTAPWAALGLEGPQRVKNLWTHMELGQKDGSVSQAVPRHGAVLLKIGKW